MYTDSISDFEILHCLSHCVSWILKLFAFWNISSPAGLIAVVCRRSPVLDISAAPVHDVDMSNPRIMYNSNFPTGVRNRTLA